MPRSQGSSHSGIHGVAIVFIGDLSETEALYFRLDPISVAGGLARAVTNFLDGRIPKGIRAKQGSLSWRRLRYRHRVTSLRFLLQGANF